MVFFVDKSYNTVIIYKEDAKNTSNFKGDYMKVNAKIWLEDNDQIIFGQGPRELLTRVKKLGSLSKAASSMKMSYSKAWNLINRIETELGYKLLEKKVGGVSGGSSTLTEEGEQFIEKYNYIEAELKKTMEKLSKEIF